MNSPQSLSRVNAIAESGYDAAGCQRSAHPDNSSLRSAKQPHQFHMAPVIAAVPKKAAKRRGLVGYGLRQWGHGAAGVIQEVVFASWEGMSSVLVASDRLFVGGCCGDGWYRVADALRRDVAPCRSRIGA